MDTGAAGGNDCYSWAVVSAMLMEGPLEPRPGGENMLWLGFREPPYQTVLQAQESSQAPRIDPLAEESTREIQLSDAAEEALARIRQIEVSYCHQCSRVRLPLKTMAHTSICVDCTGKFEDTQARQHIAVDQWYHVAGSVLSGSLPHGHCVQRCTLCAEPILLTRVESRHYCKYKGSAWGHSAQRVMTG